MFPWGGEKKSTDPFVRRGEDKGKGTMVFWGSGRREKREGMNVPCAEKRRKDAKKTLRAEKKKRGGRSSLAPDAAMKRLGTGEEEEKKKGAGF